MKAVVMYRMDLLPEYTDLDEPVVSNEDELLMTVKAAAIKHIDKSIAQGSHYTVEDKKNARIIGGDGVGTLEDGRRVFAMGVEGMVAEKALVRKNTIVAVPPEMDDVTAAALPNAVVGSAMALLYRASLKKGETVLINGATGFTGKIAVQIAKHYGAGNIIVTGRNEKTLKSLLSLGAAEIITLNQGDEDFTARLKQIYSSTPIDIIIDYLWGHTAELILSALKGKGNFTQATRFVSIGAVTGDTIQLSAQNLRSVDLQLCGSGLGSWTAAQVQCLFQDILPEMFQLAANNKLKVDTVSFNMKEINSFWNSNMPDGKRVVVLI
jgi:NADPH:quinone reductase-like Zn-dependent oxidoreductase